MLMRFSCATPARNIVAEIAAELTPRVRGGNSCAANSQ
jgi:hypothetical protein